MNKYKELVSAEEALNNLYGCLFNEHTPAEEDMDKYLVALDTALNLIAIELEFTDEEEQ